MSLRRWAGPFLNSKSTTGRGVRFFRYTELRRRGLERRRYMASDRLIPFTVEMVTTGKGVYTPAEWRTRARGQVPAHGKPNAENLKAYIAKFEDSTKPGGVNAHLGVTVVFSAFIKDQRTGETLATYRGPSFVVV